MAGHFTRTHRWALRLVVGAAIGASAVWLALPSSGASVYLDPGFFEETVVAGLDRPVAIEFLPDDRILVAEKAGVVEMIDGGTINPTPFIDISDEVNSVHDRGLLGLAAHPNFPTAPYVYLLYVYDPPETVGQTGRAGPDGSGHRGSRLMRVTANSATGYATAVSGSEVILMGSATNAANIGDLSLPMDDSSEIACAPLGTPVEDCIPADGVSHSIGALRFGTDGMLYVANGDSSSFSFVDARALRALDLDSMAGKLFRIDPITGQGVSGNPFWDGDPDSNQSKVLDLGLRNPFRFSIDPYSGQPWIGDVGWGLWEEINAGSGRDFGWPCYEGGSGSLEQQAGYAALAGCTTYYASNSAVAADFAWNHPTVSAAGLAGPVYTSSAYPAGFDDVLFIADYAQGWIRYLETDGAGSLAVDGGGNPIVHTFASNVFALVDMAIGPDGNLHYVNFLTGELIRVRYDNSADPPPVRYEYFEGDWLRLPDFDVETPLTTGFIGGFDTSPRLNVDDFGFRFRACLETPSAGSYTFYTTSDDGSQLLIADLLIVDNDGMHGAVEVSASITLGVATTPIEVRYFDAGGNDSLSVEWEGPSIPRQSISASALVGCDTALAATPASVVFGSVDTGTFENSSVSLQHTGGATQPDLKISDISMTGSPNFTHSASLPVTLSPGQSTVIPITFTPTIVGPIIGDLVVIHSGTNDPLVVPISGTGTNEPPVPVILSPANGQSVRIGDILSVSGSATDAEDGDLIGPSLVWTGTLIHSGHAHPGLASFTGTTGTYEIPDHGDDTQIELCLAATDIKGSKVTTCVDVVFDEIMVTFTSDPSGLDLTYNGVASSTPFVVSTYANAQRSISAPVDQSGWKFDSWNHGGPSAQTVLLGDADTTFTANYLPPPSGFVDVPPEHPFADDIAWLKAMGITVGCTEDRFCPENQVTRGQTASLLVNALGLTEGSTIDAFTDDSGNIHEPNINRIAYANITNGCTTTTYCPNATVSRGQIATLLVNALGLTEGSTVDAFTDDSGNIHEPNINRIAYANITNGCTATTYCPHQSLTRGQLAALLRRALTNP